MTERAFYDLDWYIEKRFRAKIPDIFESGGEERFRTLERRMLHEVAEFEDTVVSCGGGTPCFFDNMDYMNSRATTVYLCASAETILEHIAISRGRRPLLESAPPDKLGEYVRKQLSEREPHYLKAQYTQEISPLYNKKDVSRMAEMIIEKLDIPRTLKNEKMAH